MLNQFYILREPDGLFCQTNDKVDLFHVFHYLKSRQKKTNYTVNFHCLPTFHITSLTTCASSAFTTQSI